jgi:hypothetical protein
MWIVKPLAGTEFASGDAGKRLVHGFSRSAHALFLCVFLVLILVLVDNVWHVDASFATPMGTVTAYDFDPTTSPKKSGKTPFNKTDGGGNNRLGSG